MSGVRDVNGLRAFTGQILSEDFLELFRGSVSYDIGPLIPIIRNYAEETEFGLQLISSYPLEKLKVLEIGAGAGILTAWLSRNGIDITGIEPSGIGYDFHWDLKEAIWKHFQLPQQVLLDYGIEDIPKLGKKYDLMFSVNVLEHIPFSILEPSFNGMREALAPGGTMLHHCPNYFIPFEPHYGFPLIPFLPKLTGPLMGVSRDGVWKSLNFINYSRVKRMARRAGLTIAFRKAVMMDTFRRLDDDPVFAGRHKALSRIYPLMKNLGFNLFLKSIPAALSTPMTFTCRSQDDEKN